MRLLLLLLALFIIVLTGAFGARVYGEWAAEDNFLPREFYAHTVNTMQPGQFAWVSDYRFALSTDGRFWIDADGAREDQIGYTVTIHIVYMGNDAVCVERSTLPLDRYTPRHVSTYGYYPAFLSETHEICKGVQWPSD